jgi:type II secretory pathway component PulF
MSLAARGRFFRQLAVLTRTGMPIANALRLAGDTAGAPYRLRAAAWAEGCTRGADLASQMRSAGEAPFPIALVRAGESTGRLPELAARIADHDDQMQALRSLAIGKLVYPLFLLHVALVVPAVPSVVAGNSSTFWLLAGPLTLWLVVGGLLVLGKIWHASGVLARLALLPGPRLLSLPFLTCNVCLVLAAALAAGLKYRDGLELAAAACGNRVLRDRLLRLATDIDRGAVRDLTTALKQAGFNHALVSLIASGEQSGTLDRSLDQAAVAAREAFQMRALWATKLFTGAIYGLVVLFVAWQIVSMYAGILQGAGGDPYAQ